MRRLRQGVPVADARLARARAELVRRYRANPRLWPDGIDGRPGSGCQQWYRGHELDWDEATDPRGARSASRPAGPEGKS